MRSPEELRKLSELLDQALDLPASERVTWLENLQGDAARLGPTLREMLERAATRETADLLERGPSMTGMGPGADDPSFVVGDTVGPYRLVRELGRGGMGEVWLAERTDGQLKRPVALKLPMLGVRRGILVERFSRERDILGSLVHPHIARLYDAGLTEDAQPYMALEYVQGTTLTAHCDEHRLGTAQRLALVMQVLEAVQYAHTRLVIHRDLKPSNILVTDDGEVRLLDFGVAKFMADEGSAEQRDLTQVAGRVFTPDYASPEQVRGDKLGTASDVYSLGVLLYELLCGQRPYKLKRASAAQLEQAILEAEPSLPSGAVDAQDAQTRNGSLRELQRQLRGDLDTIVLKALKKRPEDRYGTVAELAEDLRRYRDGEPVLARPDAFAYRARKYVLRNKLLVGSGSAVMLALGIGLGVAVWQYRKAVDQANIAREAADDATAVQAFMEDIFRANSVSNPDPQAARRRTAEELIDLARTKAEKSLISTPVARLRMLKVLAEIYQEMDLVDQSVAMAKLAVETAEGARFKDLKLLEALQTYCDVLDNASRIDEAEVVLQKIVALSAELKVRDPIRLGRLEASLGSIALQRVSPDAASHLERAIQLFRQGRSDNDLLESLFLKANLLTSTYGDGKSALPALIEAQAVIDRIAASGLNGIAVHRQVSVYQERSRASSQMGDGVEAEKYARLALAAALALDERDQALAKAEGATLMSALIEAAKPLDAIEYGDRNWALSKTRAATATPNYLLWLLEVYAAAQMSAGRAEDALASLSVAWQMVRGANVQPDFEVSIPARQAEILIDLGDHAGAEAALNVARTKNGVKRTYLLRAEAKFCIVRHDGKCARNKVSSWTNSATPPGSIRARCQADRLLGEAAILEGHWAEADEQADKMLRLVNSAVFRPGLADVEAQALWIRGRSFLGRGAADVALASLSQAIDLMDKVVDRTVSVELGSMLGSLALAQFRAGDTGAARLAFNRMKSIFDRHLTLGRPLRDELTAIGKELGIRS